jgi:hypothetical protein
MKSATTHGRLQRRLALTLLLGLVTSNLACARNVALLVAVGRFNDPAVPQLYGTAADIDSMQQTIVRRWRFAPGDVVTLRDKEATHDRILIEIAALEQRSAAGDTVLIYFSGHGTSANDQDNAYDLPYATGAWVPYDFDSNSPLRTLIVGRRDLLPRLKRLDDAGRLVVVVSDSCYSGQVVRSLGHAHGRSRYLPIHARDLGVASVKAAAPAVDVRPPPPPYPYQHVILLSGASDSEEGTDISTAPDLQLWPTLDGQFHGAFTDALLRLLDGDLALDGRVLGDTFSYAQGRDALNSFLEARKFPQHPQLLPAIAEDPQNIGSNRFLAALSIPPTSASPIPPPAASQASPSLRVRLQGVSSALRASIEALHGIAIVDGDSELTVRQSGENVQLLGPAEDPILSSGVGDANVTKRIAAQAWVDRVLPAGSNQLGLRAETDPGSRGNTFVRCESFAFEVRLQKAAYLMVLDLDPQGQLTVLYPTHASERQIVGSGAPKAIPGADLNDRILVTPPFGTDRVAVLAFERLPRFFAEQNSAQPFAIDSARAEALARGLEQITGRVDVQQMDVHTYAGDGKGSCGP